MRHAQRHPVRRLAEIDGLRGLAALSVLLYHAWLYTRPHVIGARAGAAWEYGVHELRLGLVLFFVLSGFLLYGPWVGAALAGERRPRLGTYLRHRAARILPAYYLALLGSILLLWSLDAAEGVRLPDAGELPLFFVFAQNYSNGPLMSLDPPMWTLCVEISYYLLLPLVGGLAWAVRGGRCRQALLPLALLAGGLAFNRHIVGSPDAGLLAKTLPAMLPYFAVGMLAATLAHGRHVSRRWTAALLAGGALAVVADGAWHASGAFHGALAPDQLVILRDLPAAAGFAAIMAAATRGAGASARSLGARPLAALGTVSYGVYLWHVPLMLWLHAHGLLPLAFLPAAAVGLAVAVAVATASWLALERPFIERARRPRPRSEPLPHPAHARRPVLSRSGV